MFDNQEDILHEIVNVTLVLILAGFIIYTNIKSDDTVRNIFNTERLNLYDNAQFPIELNIWDAYTVISKVRSEYPSVEIVYDGNKIDLDKFKRTASECVLINSLNLESSTMEVVQCP